MLIQLEDMTSFRYFLYVDASVPPTYTSTSTCPVPSLPLLQIPTRKTPCPLRLYPARLCCYKSLQGELTHPTHHAPPWSS